MGEEPGQGKDLGATAPQSLSVERPRLDAAPDGFHFEVSSEDILDWQIPATGGCRMLLTNPRRGCGRPGVARLRRGNAGWWNYCEEHLYGRWIEDGKIVHWRLVQDEPTHDDCEAVVSEKGS